VSQVDCCLGNILGGGDNEPLSRRHKRMCFSCAQVSPDSRVAKFVRAVCVKDLEKKIEISL